LLSGCFPRLYIKNSPFGKSKNDFTPLLYISQTDYNGWLCCLSLNKNKIRPTGRLIIWI
jgi:hypothetical protein